METLGRYNLVSRIGTGGMAEIWKAKATGPSGFEKTVAIKKILPHLVEEGNFIEMLISEAKLVASLQHPNIVQVFDFGVIGEQEYFIAMEYISGKNLSMVSKAVNEKKIIMPQNIALYVIIEACKGLGYAHTRKDENGQHLEIIHRDVSPQNILMSYDGDVKVTDFGIAKVASALGSTAIGVLKGKLSYMSPEQAKQQPLDLKTDLFSLGIVLHELLSGERFVEGQSPADIYSKIITYEGAPMGSLGRIDPGLQEVVKKVLAPDPDDRYQTAIDLETALTTQSNPKELLEARTQLAEMLQDMFKEDYRKELSKSPPISEQSNVKASLGADLAATVAERPSWENSLAATRPVTPDEVDAARKQADSLRTRTDQTSPTTSSRHSLAGPIALILIGLAGIATSLIIWIWNNPQIGVTQTVPTLIDASNPADAIKKTAGLESATPKPSTATPTKKASDKPLPSKPKVAVAAFANLNVNAAPWVEVWMDGKRLAKETPVRKMRIKAGKHLFLFKNGQMNFSKTKTITVKKDQSLDIFVDTFSGTIEID